MKSQKRHTGHFKRDSDGVEQDLKSKHIEKAIEENKTTAGQKP